METGAADSSNSSQPPVEKEETFAEAVKAGEQKLDADNGGRAAVKEEQKENSEAAPVLEPTERTPFLPQFEFDAPRYKNFCHKKWRSTRRLLNKIVLKIDESSTSEDEDEDVDEKRADANALKDGVTEEFSLLMNFEDAEQLFSKSLDEEEGETDYEELDAWFNRFHPLHEPLRPMTPPGPLLSPERTAIQHLPLRNFPTTSSPQKPPSFSSPRSPAKQQQQQQFQMAPRPTSPLKQVTSNQSPLRPATLQSPQRKQPLQSPIKQQQHFSSNSPISGNNSPIRRMQSPLLSSPIRTFSPLARLSSLQSSPILRSPQKKSFSTPATVGTSVCSSGAAPKSPLKIGLRAKAARVLKPESPLNDSISNPPTQEPAVAAAKRKLHERNEETPAAHAASDNDDSRAKRSKRKKAAAVEVDLDDIKKLLSQHNSRLRPHSNKR